MLPPPAHRAHTFLPSPRAVIKLLPLSFPCLLCSVMLAWGTAGCISACAGRPLWHQRGPENWRGRGLVPS